MKYDPTKAIEIFRRITDASMHKEFVSPPLRSSGDRWQACIELLSVVAASALAAGLPVQRTGSVAMPEANELIINRSAWMVEAYTERVVVTASSKGPSADRLALLDLPGGFSGRPVEGLEYDEQQEAWIGVPDAPAVLACRIVELLKRNEEPT